MVLLWSRPGECWKCLFVTYIDTLIYFCTSPTSCKPKMFSLELPFSIWHIYVRKEGRGHVPWLKIFYQHHVIFKVLGPPCQRLKKKIILSQSTSLSSLSPKIYAVVMLLKVSSMAMYKPPSQNIKDISPFHHIDVHMYCLTVSKHRFHFTTW